MPKLRRLSGKQVVAIFEGFGFTVIRISGSHHRMRRAVGGRSQYLTVPVHGNKALKVGMLKGLYRDGCRHIPEDDLKPHFYTD